jgi:hypothetical protein
VRIRLLLGTIVLALALHGVASAQNDKIDLVKAQQYFTEVKAECERDGGKLWGVSLCVPMAFIDPATRDVVANMPDSAGLLKREGNVYVGVWQKELPIGNSSWKWSGIVWSTIMWPLPDDSTVRLSLLMHESFHNVQGTIGFPSYGPPNPHMDTREGRLWMQLEWRALKAALLATGKERQTAIADALTFRAYRRSLFPGSDSTERHMEMHEGLAEYTGTILCGLPAKNIPGYFVNGPYARHIQVASFVSNFAYVSGALYGLLLDNLGVAWRTGLKPENDFGDLLQKAAKVQRPASLESAAHERMAQYDGKALATQEIEREQAHTRVVADYRARLVDGPLLVLSFVKMNIQYDPRGLVALDSLGTVYPTIRVSDVWGILAVTKGGLLASNWRQIQVPAPADIAARPLVGDGWTLELNDGWKVVKGERQGDYTLEPGK